MQQSFQSDFSQQNLSKIHSMVAKKQLLYYFRSSFNIKLSKTIFFSLFFFFFFFQLNVESNNDSPQRYVLNDMPTERQQRDSQNRSGQVFSQINHKLYLTKYFLFLSKPISIK
eukprot:TRINITY_DN3606_c0_g1_i1.p1 TRINITY_DN3606_c0_g1~~TRINITY_DN3606_c0_g1_i1.p1  ORF type:complete len:113 (-),score=3.24 TRINITY_DN3606_c0_g1_i1:119-457(-)